MKVIDVIIALQKEDPNTEVMFDVTKDGSDMFAFLSVDQVDEVTTDINEKYVVLSSGVEINDDPQSLN